MIYSVERFSNDSCIVFGHYSFGVVPLISFPTLDDLDKFIILLQSCQQKTEIPEEFLRAFDGN